MKIKTKYPIRCGRVLVPKDTTGKVLTELTDRMKESFPNMNLTNEKGYLLVQFDYPGIFEIFVHNSQVIST